MFGLVGTPVHHYTPIACVIHNHGVVVALDSYLFYLDFSITFFAQQKRFYL